MGQGPSELNKPSPSEKYDDQSPRDMTHQPYFNVIEEAQAPSYESTDSAANQPEWNAWTRDEIYQDSTSPQNPFIYRGAKPANIRPKNVILFGETGAGKSSVINLMAGAEVASTSANLEGCTLQATEYSFTLPRETSLRIFDTVGLNEPEMGVNTFFGAIEKAHELITTLHKAGGIDLLLFCVRGGRITATMQKNYLLFFEFMCAKQVPLALVVTYLENEDVMEDWWDRNEGTFQDYGIHSVAHACITAIPARVTTFARKRAGSRIVLQNMLHNSLNNTNPPYVQDVRGWFATIINNLRSFVMKGLFLENRALSRRLETRCAFSRDEAQRLADMLTNSGSSTIFRFLNPWNR